MAYEDILGGAEDKANYHSFFKYSTSAWKSWGLTLASSDIDTVHMDRRAAAAVMMRPLCTSQETFQMCFVQNRVMEANI